MMQEMLRLHEEGKLDTVQERWFMSPAFEEELYDCTADPHQIHNLCNDAGYQKGIETDARCLSERMDKAVQY